MHILALHGFTGRGCDFDFLSDLIGGVWRCPDLPGHGPDPQLDCSPEATIRFIDNELSQYIRPNAESIKVLIGYSMGARAAMQHVLTNRKVWDALVLISPQPGIEDTSKRLARQASDAVLEAQILRCGVRDFIEFWQQTDLIKSQDRISTHQRSVMQSGREEHTTEGLAKSLREFGQGRCPDLWPKLKDFTIPTLIITGQEDTLYTKISNNIRCKNFNEHGTQIFQYSIIKNAGHAPHLEYPEITAKKIREFLEQISKK